MQDRLSKTDKNIVIICGIPVKIPEPPKDKKLIAGWDKPTHLQKWQRIELPESFKKLPRSNPQDYVTEEQELFIDQEWERRINGYWFYNNGEPTYITGTHYFYLNWWRIDIGYPKYRAVDRDYFYFWKMCEEDESCYGMVEATRRRQGKTFRAGCLVYEYVSRTANANGGIQSKTNSDAVKFFAKAVVSPWRKLPFFFKPNFDNTSNPKKELRFFAPARRGSKIVSEIEEDELESQIDVQSSVETAYDGSKLHRYVMDEIGKPGDANVDDRWDVVKKCLQVDGEIIGKCIGTTTVEELSSGQGNKNFKAIWDASNYYERDGNNQTKSGLYKFFQPAYVGFRIDEYGNDLIEESKKIQEATFDALKDDPMKLASEKRKMPWTESDMFRVDSAMCHFDSIKIQDRLAQLEAYTRKPYIAGQLQWVNNIKNSKVEFIQCMHDVDADYCPVCKWLIAYDPPESIRNNVVDEGYGPFRMYTPKNQLKFSAGCDPFQNKIVMDDSRGSKAAMYVKMKYDPLIDTPEKSTYDHITNRPVLEYINRPKDIYAFYDDVIKTIWYFGCELFPETNKPALKYWMQENGYQNFLTIKPEGITKENDALRAKQDGGASSTAPMISHYTDLIEYDVNQNCHKYPFPRLLEDLLHFDNSQTQKFDPSVAWGYTLVGCEKKVIKREETNSIQYIALYDSDGNRIN